MSSDAAAAGLGAAGSTTPVLLPPAGRSAELIAQIRQAELRLTTREERLQQGVSTLGRRLRRAVEPRRLVLPVAGAAAAGLALWWVTRRQRGTAHAQVATYAATPLPSQWMSMPLMHVLWPLLPLAWRARISPVAASALVSMGWPLVQRLVLPHAQAEPPATVASVDLQRYAGDWFEVARLPAPFEGACVGQPRAQYVVRDDGGVTVINRCRHRDGSDREAVGDARAVPGGGGAKLEVSLWPKALRWLPFAWADYWILHLDDDYSQALVGSPSRRFLWLLSRRPTLPRHSLLLMLQTARERGYDVDRLHFNDPD